MNTAWSVPSQREAQVLNTLHVAQGQGEPRASGGLSPAVCFGSSPRLSCTRCWGESKHRPFPSPYCFLHVNLYPLLTKKAFPVRGNGDQDVLLKKNHSENSVRQLRRHFQTRAFYFLSNSSCWWKETVMMKTRTATRAATMTMVPTNT